jgi:hypothetical protein
MPKVEEEQLTMMTITISFPSFSIIGGYWFASWRGLIRFKNFVSPVFIPNPIMKIIGINGEFRDPRCPKLTPPSCSHKVLVRVLGSTFRGWLQIYLFLAFADRSIFPGIRYIRFRRLYCVLAAR